MAVGHAAQIIKLRVNSVSSCCTLPLRQSLVNSFSSRLHIAANITITICIAISGIPWPEYTTISIPASQYIERITIHIVVTLLLAICYRVVLFDAFIHRAFTWVVFATSAITVGFCVGRFRGGCGGRGGTAAIFSI
jgi:hypothetical protein